jgi:hypothetical protein
MALRHSVLIVTNPGGLEFHWTIGWTRGAATIGWSTKRA